MLPISQDDFMKFAKDRNEYWSHIEVKKVTTTQNGTDIFIPQMKAGQTIGFNCLRCDSKYLHQSCSNCGHGTFEFGYDRLSAKNPGLFCSTCNQGFSVWTCAHCETNNPVSKTLLLSVKPSLLMRFLGLLMRFLKSNLFLKKILPVVLILSFITLLGVSFYNSSGSSCSIPNKMRFDVICDLPTDIKEISISPDGKRVAVSNATELVVVDIDSRKPIFSYGEYPQYIYNVNFSPDSEQIVFAIEHDRNREIHLFDLTTQQEIDISNHPIDFDPLIPKTVTAQSITWTNDGLYTQCARLSDGKMNANIERLYAQSENEYDQTVLTLICNPNTDLVISASRELIGVWDSNFQEITQIKGSNMVALSPDGEMLAYNAYSVIVLHERSNEWDSNTRIYTVPSGAANRMIQFTPDGTQLITVSSSYNGALYFWDVNDRYHKSAPIW